jgi:hypothetical protein
MKTKPLLGALAAAALVMSTSASAAATAAVAPPAAETVTDGSQLDSLDGVSPAILIIGAIALGLAIYFLFIDDDDEEDTPVSP